MIKTRRNKLAAIFTALSFAATIISASYIYFFPMYLLHKSQLNRIEPSSIGIIGGADGPTSIYVASKFPQYIIIIIFALFTVVGILYQIFLAKNSGTK